MYSEGKAKITGEGAFLNPKARFLRDTSIAFVSATIGKGAKILDPTAATGIRGIRYYLETKAKDVTLLEINKEVSAIARKNARANRAKVKVLNKSIQEFANTAKERFDVIDLDPFGSIAPDLYDIMKISKAGTVLMLTATDTAVLCGAHEKACLKIYDAKPMHNELCHETGLRILIGFVARTAAQFNFGIEVLLSFTYEHYMRIFVRLRPGADPALSSMKGLGYAHYCPECGNRGTQQGFFPALLNCNLCKSKLVISGKMWLGPLIQKQVLRDINGWFLKNNPDKRSLKLLGVLMTEPDIPLYYSIPKTTKRMGIPGISPDAVIKALKKRKFVAERTHFDESAIKTNAGIAEVKRTINNERRK